MGRMTAESQEVETPKTPAALTDEPSDQVVLRWRRLMIMVGLVDVHASSGAIMSHLERMRERIEEEARRAYEKAAGTKAAAKKAFTKARDKPQNKEATEVGKPLSRSPGTFVFDPDMCAHPRLVPRGNKDLLWFTCLKCGSRWERVAPVPLLVPQAMPLVLPQAPSRSAAPPVSAAAASGPVASTTMTPASTKASLQSLKQQTHALVQRLEEQAPVDKQRMTYLDPNQKRKTEDFQMVGLSALGQKVFERYQEMAQADVPHESITQRLMSLAQTQEEVAGVLEVIRSLQDS